MHRLLSLSIANIADITGNVNMSAIGVAEAAKSFHQCKTHFNFLVSDQPFTTLGQHWISIIVG